MNWTSALIAIQQMDPIVAVMATIMTIYFLYKSGSNIIPKIIGKKKIEEKCTLLDAHKNCINYPSVANILERVMEKSDRIFRIRYQETLYEQMNDAELLWDAARDDLMANFLLVLKDQDFVITKAEIPSALFIYSKIIDSMEVDVLGVIRRWMRKNHFIDKSEIEYDQYIEEKIELLHDKIVRLFDESYNDDKLLIERSLLRDSFDIKYFASIQKRARIFFLKAKATAHESARRIAEIEEEIAQI